MFASAKEAEVISCTSQLVYSKARALLGSNAVKGIE
jgi:hypothetical protein